MTVISNSTIYIDEKKTSQITGRSVQTLRNDRHRGRGIPYSKIGRSVRYSLEDIHAYMQQRKIETQPY